MKITFDEPALQKIQSHLNDKKKLLLTFEDGVGPYSQHAMIHMQVQFTLNIVDAAETAADYDTAVPSNLGDIWIKGYSSVDLDPNMTIRYQMNRGMFTLSGDGGMIDDNLGFIDFTGN